MSPSNATPISASLSHCGLVHYPISYSPSEDFMALVESLSSRFSTNAYNSKMMGQMENSVLMILKGYCFHPKLRDLRGKNGTFNLIFT